MRAITYTQTGPSTVLRLTEREIPAPGPDEVRVRLHVSGVNPADWKVRAGAMWPVSTETVPHIDGAGVVDAVGDGVSGVGPGDRVWVLSSFHLPRSGTAQEYAVLPANRVFPLPEGASFELGASIGVPTITAHRALTVGEGFPARLAAGSLTGRTILVAGGAGAVGHAALQLARWAGATTIATVSGPEKAALAAAGGADHVVTYTAPDAAEQVRAIAPDGVDLVVELAPSANQGLDAAVLKPTGTIAVYSDERGEGSPGTLLAFMQHNARIQLIALPAFPQELVDVAAADIAGAFGALAVGAEAGLPLRTFPLADVAAAHDAAEAGFVGKVLVDLRT
jgi:NADPH:quinone reductase